MELVCPDCGSSNIKKSSAVFEQGSSNSRGSGGGVGISSKGSVGAFSHKFESERVTSVAQRNAKPIPPGGCGAASSGIAVIALGGGFAGLLLASGELGTGLFVVVLALVIGIGIMIGSTLFPSEEFRAIVAKNDDDYNRQWYCYKCGSIFNL